LHDGSVVITKLNNKPGECFPKGKFSLGYMGGDITSVYWFDGVLFTVPNMYQAIFRNIKL